MRLIDSCSHALVPGLARRLLLAVLAALALAVAASPAGAAGHANNARQKAGANPNTGIVDIYTTLGYQNGVAAGTGMILSRTGEVLTNNHVIRGATKFRVVDASTHRSYLATVVGYSVVRDIAVLQLAQASHLKTVRLGRSVRVHVGQRVVARGNAQGRGGLPRAARGKIVGLHRKIVALDETGNTETLANLIATNAHVVPGDSGGPLQDSRNRVIGMVTAGSASGSAHRGFAIPIRPALLFARLIMNGSSSAAVHVGPTAFLGVGLDDAAGGAVVTQILPGLAAESAGLAVGDVITSLDGATISSSADVRQAVLGLVPGTAITIGWTDRNGNAQTGSITPTSGPPQ
jgi:S1-C subfamily serine protease